MRHRRQRNGGFDAVEPRGDARVVREGSLGSHAVSIDLLDDRDVARGVENEIFRVDGIIVAAAAKRSEELLTRLCR